MKLVEGRHNFGGLNKKSCYFCKYYERAGCVVNMGGYCHFHKIENGDKLKVSFEDTCNDFEFYVKGGVATYFEDGKVDLWEAPKYLEEK